jgi:hypothetical protein
MGISTPSIIPVVEMQLRGFGIRSGLGRRKDIASWFLRGRGGKAASAAHLGPWLLGQLTINGGNEGACDF